MLLVVRGRFTLINSSAQLHILFWGEIASSVGTLGKKSLRADKSLGKAFVNESLDWEWLHLSIGQQDFQICCSKELNVQSTRNPSDPNGLGQSSDAGAINPLETVECGE